MALTMSNLPFSFRLRWIDRHSRERHGTVLSAALPVDSLPRLLCELTCVGALAMFGAMVIPFIQHTLRIAFARTSHELIAMLFTPFMDRFL